MLLLRVFVVPGGAKSVRAIEEAAALQAQHPDELCLEVVDVTREPEAAERFGLLTFPAVVLTSPVQASTGVPVRALVPDAAGGSQPDLPAVPQGWMSPLGARELASAGRS